MIQRDIAEMVRACIEDQATQSSGGKAKRFGTIDTVLHSELDAFTSLEFDNAAEDGQVVAPADGGLQVGSFIDPRAWSSEADWPSLRSSGRRDTVGEFPRRDSHPYQRDTVNDMQARGSQSLPAAAPPAQPPMVSPPAGPMAKAQVFSQPAQIPRTYAPMQPQPVRPHVIPRGVLLGIMAGAVIIGALFAWLLFSGR